MESLLAEGTHCLAAPGGWGDAIVRRVNEDGTYKIEYDEKDMILMPYWYGVTNSELSVNDETQWGEVVLRISSSKVDFSRADFSTLLLDLGYSVTGDDLNEFWVSTCGSLFALAPDSAFDTHLDFAQAYQIIRKVGLSARQIGEWVESGPGAVSYYKLYWNQSRMGGRNPAEITREITVHDAFAALGVHDDLVDKAAVQALDAWQLSNGVRLPPNLLTVLTRQGIAMAVRDCHPNNPELPPMFGPDFGIHSSLRDRGIDGDFALTLMLPHQGDHSWFAVFDDGDDDARVYVGSLAENENCLLTAPTIAFFFWDLAQTGLGWYLDTGMGGGKPTIRTDVGLALIE